MSGKYFIKRHPEGDFTVRKGNSDTTIEVERVRDTETGGRDKWLAT